MYRTPDKAVPVNNKLRLLTQVVVTGLIAILIVHWMFPDANPMQVIKKAQTNTTGSYFQLGMKSLEEPEGARAAITYFSKALEEDPENPEIYYYRSMASCKLERIHECLLDIEKALELTPDDPKIHYWRATVYQHGGNQEEVLKNLDRTIELQPDHFNALTARAFVHRDAEMVDAALSDFTAAIAAKPDDLVPEMVYNIYVGRAAFYMQKGMAAEAIDDYLTTIQAFPADYEQLPMIKQGLRAQIYKYQEQLDKITPESDAFLKLSELMTLLEATE